METTKSRKMGQIFSHNILKDDIREHILNILATLGRIEFGVLEETINKSRKKKPVSNTTLWRKVYELKDAKLIRCRLLAKTRGVPKELWLSKKGESLVTDSVNRRKIKKYIREQTKKGIHPNKDDIRRKFEKEIGFIETNKAICYFLVDNIIYDKVGFTSGK